MAVTTEWHPHKAEVVLQGAEAVTTEWQWEVKKCCVSSSAGAEAVVATEWQWEVSNCSVGRLGGGEC